MNEIDFCCSDCNEHFESASYLLLHFAQHASQINNNSTAETEENILQELFKSTDKKNIPDLYPLDVVQKNQSEVTRQKQVNYEDEVYNHTLKNLVGSEDDTNSNTVDQVSCNDNGDFFNPLKYCSISMDEVKNEKTKKKYPCTFCFKVFGWSTDLKRHLLIHTGERPFQCKSCGASFTRNFLLQKHEMKIHHQSKWNAKSKLPSLNPIFDPNTKTKDSRKQDKQKIRRKCFYQPQPNEIDTDFCGIIRTQLNLIETNTIVQ